MFRLIAIDFSQKSPHFTLLSPTSPCELSEREVTSPSNLKVVGALDNYSLVFVIVIIFFGQLNDWVGQVLFLVSCPKGQVEKYVNVEAWPGIGILWTGADTLNSVQASYFERFHWPILNFWTLTNVEHDGNGTRNSMLRGLLCPKILNWPMKTFKNN